MGGNTAFTVFRGGPRAAPVPCDPSWDRPEPRHDGAATRAALRGRPALIFIIREEIGEGRFAAATKPYWGGCQAERDGQHHELFSETGDPGCWCGDRGSGGVGPVGLLSAGDRPHFGGLDGGAGHCRLFDTVGAFARRAAPRLPARLRAPPRYAAAGPIGRLTTLRVWRRGWIGTAAALLGNEASWRRAIPTPTCAAWASSWWLASSALHSWPYRWRREARTCCAPLTVNRGLSHRPGVRPGR